MGVRQGLDQLHIDPHGVTRLLYAAFENMGDSELFRDLADVAGLASKLLCRSARNNLEIGDFGESRQDLILHAFGEVSVIRIAAKIVEGKHRDAFLRNGRSSSCRRLAVESE